MFTQGQKVKFTRPQDDAERAARFVVVEDRGSRVLVELLASGMAIAPQECVPSSEIEPAE